MKGHLTKIALALSALPLCAHAWVVQKIEYQGVERVPISSVIANTPVKVGQDLTPVLSNQVVSDLFKTGYFKNVQLFDQNGTLLIQVEELPTIASIDFKGNELIKTDQLKTVLNNVGLQVGNIFSQTLINQIKQSLVNEYNNQGKYAVQVKVDIKPMSDNRVGLTVDVSEGLDAKIQSINITGNHDFSNSKLVDQLPISTPGLIAFFTSADVFTPDKMQKTIQALTDFYLDHGYLDFQVNSAEASLNSTNTKAYVTLNVTEGPQYKFAGFGFKGDLILSKADLEKLVSIKPGEIYSKSVLTNSQKAIVYAVGDKGYAFVNVNPVPTVDKKKRTVFINFYITPGQKVYVHQLDFDGNTVTNDKTLRERMKFVEGSTYSKTKIDESKVALQRLPFMQQVSDKVTPVAGTDNQVNVDYKVKEQASNTVSGAIGYGGLYGVLFNASFNMNNLFGTGNTFGINAQVSRPYQSASINFSQPFFTMSGVQQSESIYYSRTNVDDMGLTNFSVNAVGGTLNYSIPISTWNFFNVGFGYDHSTLQQPGTNISETIDIFVNQHGSSYNTYSMTLGLSRDSTNSAYFPTQGMVANVGGKIAVPGSNLEWYQLNANANWYHAINQYVTVMLSGGMAYGSGYGNTDHLPFFLNYYAGGWGNGGVGTVRGYQSGQMGPKDTTICTNAANGCTVGQTSEGSALGGNLLVDSTLQFYFPVPFYNKPNLKLISFLDAGNVYQTYYSPSTWSGTSNHRYPSLNNIGYTAGVGVEFVIPMLGAMGFSLAAPLNSVSSDGTEVFQFNLGAVF